MNYETHIILDFEFNPTRKTNRDILRQEIIEIGAVKLNSRLEEIDRFSCYVRPELSDRMAPDIARLTGIRDADLLSAPDFMKAMEMFNEWVGTRRSRIYSWSSSDLYQLDDECWAKDISFPSNIHRWMDLQRVWQRLIGYSRGQSMPLKLAAEQAGVTVDGKKAHRAVYDSAVTAEILRRACDREHMAGIIRAKKAVLTGTAGSFVGISGDSAGRLAELMQRLKSA